ncbi:MAG: hypothetical protein WAQ53_09615 [Thiofilum sp.]|uniref:hypothetical protein n=1 Tax=Thiofilum sp. TaxID=2212733 RepID=UPI0025F99DC2|nr:hypothetical protein [Thiofilum sp.]MBK8453115.1 hypothetical protein [Thiofilum sp.]
MSDFIYYIIGLVLIGLPCLVFYRVGIDVGIQRGVKRQMVRQLIARGIIDPSHS